MVTLTPIDQSWKSERFEVGVGKPNREGFGPSEVPGAASTTGRVGSQSRTNSQFQQCRAATAVGFPLPPSLVNEQVTFRWRDRAHNNQEKLLALSLDEVLRRFLLHLLPKGFVRIRYFGFLANRRRATLLPLCLQLLGALQLSSVWGQSAKPTVRSICTRLGRHADGFLDGISGREPNLGFNSLHRDAPTASWSGACGEKRPPKAR